MQVSFPSRSVWKRLAIVLVLTVVVALQACSSPASGLKAYIDATKGYRFLYPIGWVAVKVAGGPDVVFRDLIQETENVSVVINPVPSNKTLTDLGSPTEVGYRLSKSAIAPPGSGRTAELVNAESREANGKTYYFLEYAVKLPNQERHNLASVAVSRGQLYTLNVSALEGRWDKVKSMFETVVKSFSVD
jgi:photosystem II oxygen-evolving enhancer protein 2